MSFVEFASMPAPMRSHTAVKVVWVRLPSCGRCGRRSGCLTIDICGFSTNDKINAELYSRGDQLERRSKQTCTLSEFNAAEYQLGTLGFGSGFPGSTDFSSCKL
jgi:hypothetical protein